RRPDRAGRVARGRWVGLWPGRIGGGGTGGASSPALPPRDDFRGGDSLPDLFLLSFAESVAGFLASPFLAGPAGRSAAGSGSTSGGATAAEPGRGQEKSSARPEAAGKGSPRVNARTAVGSERACVARPPPTRSPPSAAPAVNGKTGPTSGRVPVVAALGVVSGAGRATGAIRPDIARRSSRST